MDDDRLTWQMWSIVILLGLCGWGCLVGWLLAVLAHH